MKLLRTSALLVLILALHFVNHAAGQSLVTGSIVGTVKDPTPAVVPNALVDLQSLDTGESQSTTTNAEGVYRLAQLKPGRYRVSVAVRGFAKMVSTGSVDVGRTTTIDLNLEISRAFETIELKGEAPLINTDPGTVTSFTPREVALLPAAGGDITTIAFTAPGVVVAQGTGFGNFSANGLPGTSNLFTVNGQNDMDPSFGNVNASGATNLTLGLNEVEEATVVTNPYSGQYGQLSGAQISYVTKSGTNQFHGNAQWWWNGRAMNSNNYLLNASQSPRPFANANQWAASVGGPIVKDHTWFFVDTEGLRFVLPNVYTVTMPTPAFAAAVLGNIQTAEPAELPAYQQMFNIYANAAKGKVPTPLPALGTECASFSLPGWTAGSPCAQTIVTAPTSFAKEWTLAGRVDQKLTSKDDFFFRFKLDYGVQPTLTDALDPAFNGHSNQDFSDYQAQERHVFNSNIINLFTASLRHGSGLFVQNVSQWQSAFPYGGVQFNYADGFSGINPNIAGFPAGGNTTQYQFIDDFSWVRGKHSLKFGLNFRRYDISDHRPFFFPLPVFTYPTTSFSDLTAGAGTTGLQAFANGVANAYYQQDNNSNDVPIASWGMGIYAEDQWTVSSNFMLTGALRFEHNSNPVCQTNCFPNFKRPFPTLATVQAGTGAGDVPYSSDINTNLHQAFMGTDAINVSPRLAFSWSPRSDNQTLVSGGIGIFYDNLAVGVVDQLLGNPPAAVFFYISPLDANFATTGILPFDKTNGGPAAFAAASAAFSVNKSFNQLSSELDPIFGFNPPLSFTSIQGTIHSPQVQEWNLKLDRQIGNSTVVSVNYVGNHSIYIPYLNSWWNAFASDSVFANVPGVHSAPVVPNYAAVTTLQSGAVANYNGVTLSVREQYHNWILAHVNYTFSHALDETSNGGIFPIGNNSLQYQINPGSLRSNNYGNADYDIRHLFNADYVISPVVHFENRIVKGLLGGWQWSGKVYVRSGFPFSVIDGSSSFSAIAQGNGAILAQQVGGIPASSSCGSSSANTNGAANFGTTACLNPAAFVNTQDPSFKGFTSWPTQTRNQFRGPHYIDFDMSLFKTFQIKESITVGVGATAFNVFNHPNFNLPDFTLGDATFGQITSMQGVPTSPYGNGLGFDSSVRVVQLSAKLNF
jgi:hypothetical protein